MASRRAFALNDASSSSVMLTVFKFALLALLAYACARIVLPFISILLWSVILAVMLYPLHVRLRARVGNRWSAVLIGVVGIALLVAPMVMVATSLVSSAAAIVSGLQHNTLTVPPPPARLVELPLIGPRLTEAWTLVASNTTAALAKYGPMLRGFATWLLSFARGLAAAELSFVLSFGIAAVLIAYGKSAAEFAQRLLQLVTGLGERMAGLIVATIRGVAIGIVGVAAIQAALLGLGFFVIGLPGAGLLTLIVFLLGIVQIPATLLTLPIIAYAFTTEATGTALIFAVWTLVAGLSDNVLKPLMLGRGLEAPMPVILIGVIGGMIADGLLGLFVGPVLLAVGYVLFMDWVRRQPAESRPQADLAAP